MIGGDQRFPAQGWVIGGRCRFGARIWISWSSVPPFGGPWFPTPGRSLLTPPRIPRSDTIEKRLPVCIKLIHSASEAYECSDPRKRTENRSKCGEWRAYLGRFGTQEGG